MSLSIGKCQRHREQHGASGKLQAACYGGRVIKNVGEGQEMKLYKKAEARSVKGLNTVT